MREFVDNRHGKNGWGIYFYALGPLFFGSVLVYYGNELLRLWLNGNLGQEGDGLFILVGVFLLLFILDTIAVIEARRIVQRISENGNSVLIKPLLGSEVRVFKESVVEVRPCRSSGLIPGFSFLNNDRKNTKIATREGKSYILFGCDDSDSWVYESFDPSVVNLSSD